MEVEEGIVQSTKNQKAWVRIQQRAGCATCSSRDSCEIISQKETTAIEVGNSFNAKTGDLVEISMPEGSLLRLSFLVYFLPIVALICGAVVGARMAVWSQTDETLMSVLGGGIFMAIVFGSLKWFEHQSKVMDKYSPHITRILASEPSGSSGHGG